MTRKEYVKRATVFLLAWIILVYSAMYVFSFQHEFIHKQVWEYFGCEANITVYPGYGVTMHDCSMVNLTPTDKLIIFDTNMINEIVGYNSLFLGFMMMGIFMIYMVATLLFPRKIKK